jgi:hypothetical protein
VSVLLWLVLSDLTLLSNEYWPRSRTFVVVVVFVLFVLAASGRFLILDERCSFLSKMDALSLSLVLFASTSERVIVKVTS